MYGHDIERNGFVGQAGNSPEEQPMVVPKKIRVVQFVRDEIPGVIVEQQPA